MSKPRSDSPLKNLPEDRQEQIIDWCNASKSDDCIGGHKFAKAQLAADGIKTSEGALSEFYSWWYLRRTFQEADNLTRQFEEMLKRTFPDIDPEKITQAGQLIFTLQATNARNAEEFREMEYLRLAKETGATKARQKDEELRLAARRVELLEQNQAKAKEKLEGIKTSPHARGLSVETLKTIEEAAKLL